MTREQYESLALLQLREIAKARGLKGVSTLKKSGLIDVMLNEDVRLAQSEAQKQDKKQQETKQQDQAEPAKPQPAVEQAAKSESNFEQSGRDTNSQTRQNSYSQSSYNRQNSYGSSNGSRQQDRNQTERRYQARNNDTRTFESRNNDDRSQDVRRTAQTETKNEPVSISPDPDRSEQIERQQTGQVLRNTRTVEVYDEKTYPKELDSGEEAYGILEVMPEGYGFIRCDNFLPGSDDVYVAPSQIRRFGLKTGDILRGNKRLRSSQQEKFCALLFVKSINGYQPEEAAKRPNFEDMTPIFPNERICLETPGCSIAMRVTDLVSPVGKGQRGMIVSPPKAGKTTLLKDIAKSMLRRNPKMHMIILLIDERPEEVTDMKEAIYGENVEVIHSTFDETPEHHRRVSEMTIERAKRLVEHKCDVVILLDSITRLARAYNMVVPPSGRTLSGGLDPAALHMPKRFFGAARNMREGGSLTILATALVDTGSKMDDVVYEEFKGTGNMEMVLDRKLSEKRIFPAIDLAKSGTRREDLLLSREEMDAINFMRRQLNGLKQDDAADKILELFAKTKTNAEFVQYVNKNKCFEVR